MKWRRSRLRPMPDDGDLVSSAPGDVAGSVPQRGRRSAVIAVTMPSPGSSPGKARLSRRSDDRTAGCRSAMKRRSLDVQVPRAADEAWRTKRRILKTSTCRSPAHRNRPKCTRGHQFIPSSARNRGRTEQTRKPFDVPMKTFLVAGHDGHARRSRSFITATSGAPGPRLNLRIYQFCFGRISAVVVGGGPGAESADDKPDDLRSDPRRAEDEVLSSSDRAVPVMTPSPYVVRWCGAAHEGEQLKAADPPTRRQPFWRRVNRRKRFSIRRRDQEMFAV